MWFHGQAGWAQAWKELLRVSPAAQPACGVRVWVCWWEGCLYYMMLCCCVCWAICRAHRLFRIEVKCESALKPAVKSNKFAIVHTPQAINQQQLGAPIYVYIYPITDLWLMPLPLPMLCSAIRWPFIMGNANKTPSRADWVVIWPAVSQIANHYRCLLSLVPSALCDSLSFWFSCRWQQLGMQRIPLRTPVVLVNCQHVLRSTSWSWSRSKALALV